MLDSSALKQLDSSPDHIALLNGEADIVFVNNAWNEFGRTNGFSGHGFEGLNYLQICQQGIKEKAIGADVANRAVEDALHGRTPKSSFKICCNSATEMRWFICTIAPVNQYGDVATVMVALKDTTENHLGNVEPRNINKCSECGIELPLLIPEPQEVAQSWECAFCGNRYWAVLDDRRADHYGGNVRRQLGQSPD